MQNLTFRIIILTNQRLLTGNSSKKQWIPSFNKTQSKRIVLMEFRKITKVSLSRLKGQMLLLQKAL